MMRNNLDLNCRNFYESDNESQLLKYKIQDLSVLVKPGMTNYHSNYVLKLDSVDKIDDSEIVMSQVGMRDGKGFQSLNNLLDGLMDSNQMNLNYLDANKGMFLFDLSFELDIDGKTQTVQIEYVISSNIDSDAEFSFLGNIDKIEKYKEDVYISLNLSFELVSKNNDTLYDVDSEDLNMSLLKCIMSGTDNHLIPVIIDSGADIDWKISEKFSFLDITTGATSLNGQIYDNEEATIILLKLGIKYNYILETNGLSPFLKCVSNSMLKAVKEFVFFGVDIDQMSSEQETALHLSVYNNDYDMTKYLIDCGANVNLKTSKGYYAHDIAKKQKSQQIVKLFQKNNAKLSDINEFNDKEDEVNEVSIDDIKTFYSYFENNNFQKLSEMVEQNHEILNQEIKRDDIIGFMPLPCVIFSRLLQSEEKSLDDLFAYMDLFFENGVDANVKRGNNSNLLHILFYNITRIENLNHKDFISILKYLLVRGTDINLIDSFGNRPVEMIDTFSSYLDENDDDFINQIKNTFKNFVSNNFSSEIENKVDENNFKSVDGSQLNNKIDTKTNTYEDYKKALKQHEKSFREVYNDFYFNTMFIKNNIDRKNIQSIKEECLKHSTFTNKNQTLKSYDNKKNQEIIILDDKVKFIGREAFANNNTVKYIFLSSKTEVIRKRAFYNCKNLNAIFIPQGIQEIQDEAFRACNNLNEITLPKSLNNLGDNTFMDSGLKKIELENCSVGRRAFKNCKNLSEINLGENISKISDNAFENCKNLNKILIPKTVKRIGDFAFKGCKNLVIYTEYEKEPIDWEEDWNIDSTPVVWGTDEFIGEPQKYTKLNKYEQKKNEFKSLISKIKKSLDSDLIDFEDVKKLIDQAKDIEYFNPKILLLNIEYLLAKGDYYLVNLDFDNLLSRLDNKNLSHNLKKYYLDRVINRVGNKKDDSRYAIHIASEYHRKDIIEFLVNHGDDINKKDSDSFTPLDYAYLSADDEESKQSTIDFIIEQGGYRNGHKPWNNESQADFFSSIVRSNKNLPRLREDIVINDILNQKDFFHYKTIDGERILHYCEPDAPIKNVTLPTDFDKYTTYCFQNLKYVEKIIVPPAYGKILNTMFSNCLALKEVIINEGVTKIQENAFNNCPNLEVVYLPDSLETIGFQTFKNCGTPKLRIKSDENDWEDLRIKMPHVDFSFGFRVQPKTISSSNEGCYIATSVYGDYNHPQVKKLRKYRDNILKKSLYGKLFIKLYYILSPKVVKSFGKSKWFNKFWKKRLDRKIDILIRKNKIS